MWQPVKIHNRNTKVAIRTNNLQGRNEKRVGIAGGQRWVGALRPLLSLHNVKRGNESYSAILSYSAVRCLVV